MYFFPQLSMLESIQMVVLLVVFPMGCATKAYGAYRVLKEEELSLLVIRGSLYIMLSIKVVLGPTVAYPALF